MALVHTCRHGSKMAHKAVPGRPDRTYPCATGPSAPPKDRDSSSKRRTRTGQRYAVLHAPVVDKHGTTVAPKTGTANANGSMIRPTATRNSG